MSNSYVLVMYDVRGKQEFIFKTNKLREIVGGSWIIRDIYEDYLFESADAVGGKIYNYRKEEGDVSFSRNSFEKHIEEGYIGEIVYEGGGNFLLLFRDEQTFIDVTYQFTKTIYERIGTLRVLGTCIRINGFDAFDEDRARLYKEHRKNEAQESNIAPWSCLPIVQVDRKTSQPLVDYDYSSEKTEGIDRIRGQIQAKGIEGKLTKESTAKLLKYYKEAERMKASDYDKLSKLERDFYCNNEDLLDNLVTEKGVESQLAVVYIDGNSMGAKVQKVTEGKKTYEDCIQALRVFSTKTQQIYVVDGVKYALENLKKTEIDAEQSSQRGVEQELQDLQGEENKKVYRIVVSAGDEINFIVNAHDAFKCAENYLEYLKSIDDASACAGIAVFHSHVPYADVYRMAEEACESGKQKMKKEELQCASFVDFHICQGAIGVSLERIRDDENGDIISRPWLLWKKDSKGCPEVTTYEEVDTALEFFRCFTRTNVKGLISAAKEGIVPLQMELNRMYGHSKDKDEKKHKEAWEKLSKKLGENEKKWRGIIYDIALCYDLWFREEGKQ